MEHKLNLLKWQKMHGKIQRATINKSMKKNTGLLNLNWLIYKAKFSIYKKKLI